MRRDKLTFIDDENQEEIIFNFYTFCEVLKGCIHKYGGVSIEQASEIVDNCWMLNVPITDHKDVYYFSHEHPFHWAMICLYGEGYWEEHPELLKIPDDYNCWQHSYMKEKQLSESLYNF